MAETGTSQAKLAQLVTEKLGRLARTPLNQSTISAWARGAYQPGGPGMVALQEIAGIPVTDWIEPAADSSPSVVEDDDSENDVANVRSTGARGSFRSSKPAA